MNRTKGADPIFILSISANETDHASLASAFAHSRWVILKAEDAAAARRELQRQNVSVVVCDCDSIPEHWTEVLEHARLSPNPPSVIITSRLADDRLWTQNLELGAWDVLPKPLRAPEVVRSVRYAWEHWRNQRIQPEKAMSAAG